MNDEQHDFGMKYGHAPIAHRVAAIDFDGTIIPWASVGFRHTKALQGAISAIKSLKESGYTIVVFTSRLSPTWHAASGEKFHEQFKYVCTTLERLGIEYDYVTAEKVPCEIYIDDKAIGYNGSWDKVIAAINAGIPTDDLAWATGLFEGEGSIVFRGINRVIIQLSMSDKDAVDRLQSLLGVGGRWEEHRPGKKPIYGWRVHSGGEVKRILQAMMPWLGQRRSVKAVEALARISRNRRVAIA